MNRREFLLTGFSALVCWALPKRKHQNKSNAVFPAFCNDYEFRVREIRMYEKWGRLQEANKLKQEIVEFKAGMLALYGEQAERWFDEREVRHSQEMAS